jgi:serine/threonine protein phosphatase 1
MITTETKGNRWVVGDIHGCCRSFIRLVEDKIQLNHQDKIFLLGDYIDRGLNSKAVLDYILYLKINGYQVYGLRGNHEDVLLRCFYGSQKGQEHAVGFYELHDSWLWHGGKNTLRSFQSNHAKDIPLPYISFLDSLNYCFSLDDAVLVHAGMNFEANDPFSDVLSMMWAKDFVFNPDKINNRKLIHGHIPIPLYELQKRIDDNNPCIDLDNGCVYTTKIGMGNLVALELNSMSLKIQPNIEQNHNRLRNYISHQVLAS